MAPRSLRIASVRSSRSATILACCASISVSSSSARRLTAPSRSRSAFSPLELSAISCGGSAVGAGFSRPRVRRAVPARIRVRPRSSEECRRRAGASPRRAIPNALLFARHAHRVERDAAMRSASPSLSRRRRASRLAGALLPPFPSRSSARGAGQNSSGASASNCLLLPLPRGALEIGDLVGGRLAPLDPRATLFVAIERAARARLSASRVSA